MAKNKANTSEKVCKIDKNTEKCFASRDMSWLEFNKRVLKLADDIRIPLIERLKFLSIYYSNLDEFFMVRVGSLEHRAKYLPNLKDIKTGRTADEEVKLILAEVSEQQKTAQDIFEELIQDFKNEGIEKINFAHLSKADDAVDDDGHSCIDGLLVGIAYNEGLVILVVSDSLCHPNKFGLLVVGCSVPALEPPLVKLGEDLV